MHERRRRHQGPKRSDRRPREPRPPRIIGALIDVLNRNDWGALDQIFAPNAVIEYPQSGEVFRGVANHRAVFENYPGGLAEGRVDPVKLVPEAPKYAITPMYTMVAVEGSGDRGTGTFKTAYPDGSVWWVIVMYRAEGDRIAHAAIYFAPAFDAPDWRAPYRDQAGQDSRL